MKQGVAACDGAGDRWMGPHLPDPAGVRVVRLVRELLDHPPATGVQVVRVACLGGRQVPVCQVLCGGKEGRVSHVEVTKQKKKCTESNLLSRP